MLYYLWGVFRGKRVNCSQQVPASPKKLYIPGNTPTAIMSLPDNICSTRPIDEDLLMRDMTRDATPKVHALIDLPSVASTETTNGDCDTKFSSSVPVVNCPQVDIEQQDSRPDSRPDSLPTILKSSLQPCLEVRCFLLILISLPVN